VGINAPVTFGATASATFGTTATFSGVVALNGPVTFGATASATFGTTATFNGLASFGSTATFTSVVNLPGSSSFTSNGLTMGANTQVTLATGTTSVAPLEFALTGAALSTPQQGAVEFDGDNLYITGNTSTGSKRQIILASQVYRLTTASGATGAGGSVFGGANRPYLKANHLYSIEYNIAFVKATSGTVTYGFTNSAGVFMQLRALATTMNAGATGATTFVAPIFTTGPTGTGNTGSTGTSSVASASITTNFNGYTQIKGTVIAASDTRLDLIVSAISGGTINPLASSSYVVTDLGLASAGTGPTGPTIGNLG
jgi:filamentous hemagglutinin